MGALNIDHIYKVERILDDGEAVVNEAKSFSRRLSRQYHLRSGQTGGKRWFCGVVGNDEEGKILLKDFQKVGVDTSQIKVKPKAKTGSVLCLSDRLGRRSLYVLPGANNLLTMDDLDLSYINQAEMLHLSSFADDRQFKILLELIESWIHRSSSAFPPGHYTPLRDLKALRQY